MTVDYQELNKFIPPIYVTVPSVVDLMDWVTNGYHFVADLANAFFSIDIAPESQDQFAFTWEGQQWTFTVLPQGYLHSLTTCDGPVAEDLAKCPWPAEMCLFHHIDDILLTRDAPTELEKAVLQLLFHLESCGWAVHEAQLQGLNCLSDSWGLSGRVRQK